MKHPDPKPDKASIFLEVSWDNGAASLPLHSSITLFLLSYTECTSFHVYLVSDRPDSLLGLSGMVPKSLAVSEVKRADVPALVGACRLPAVLDACGGFCRAGLAVVLRHIIQRTCQLEPSRTDVASLLGFKNTCLKACAEVRIPARLRGSVLVRTASVPFGMLSCKSILQGQRSFVAVGVKESGGCSELAVREIIRGPL